MSWNELYEKLQDAVSDHVMVGIDTGECHGTFGLCTEFICEVNEDDESIWIEDEKGNSLILKKGNASISEIREGGEIVGFEVNYQKQRFSIYL